MIFKKKAGPLGIAFGGGAARGFAHIGVVKVLQEAGVVPEFVAGTSAGSIVGAGLCAGLSWQELWQIAQEINWQDVAQPVFPSMGLMSTDRLEKLIDEIVKGKMLEDLQIPFCPVAIDLTSGQEVHFRNGPVGRAVRASAGLPGVFAPVELDDMVLVDGGVRSNIPVDAVREMGADFVIAVDLNDGAVNPGRPRNTFEVIFTSFMILMDQHNEQSLARADLVIRPEIAEYPYHDMTKKEALFEKGEAATRKILPYLLRKLGRRAGGVTSRSG